MTNGNGEWSAKTYPIPALRKMFSRPITTKELRETRLDNSTNIRRFRERNIDVTVVDEVPQLNIVKGWFERLPIEDRTPQDYLLHRRIQLQLIEEQTKTRAKSRAGMLAVAKAFRILATQYTDSAEELETHYAEESTDETDGSLHSSESS